MSSADTPTAPVGGLQRLLLSAFGLGLSPIMPGTCGSLGTAAAIYLGAQQGYGWAVAVGLLAFGCVVTILWGGIPRRLDGAGDPGWVVSDEVAGQALVSMVALFGTGVLPHLAAFVLFRVFDIWKPAGIRNVEHVEGGVGVLIDDVVAAVPASVLLGLGLHFGLLAP